MKNFWKEYRARIISQTILITIFFCVAFLVTVTNSLELGHILISLVLAFICVTVVYWMIARLPSNRK